MTRKSGKTFQLLVRSLTDSAYYFEKRGPSGPRFFLRLFTVNHAEARRRRPSPNVPASTHRVGRPAAAGQLAWSATGHALDHPTGDRRKKTGRCRTNFDAGQWPADAGPRTPDRQKTARGPRSSGHFFRPKNFRRRPNFRGPTRCGTSACAMFLANNYVKNGISSDLLVN